MPKLEIEMKRESGFKFGSHGDLKRLETWDEKQRQAAWLDRREKRLAKDRKRELKRVRRKPSLSKGLRYYRVSLGISRTQFAAEVGVTRRALYNYEAGTRPIPGDLLERIVARGDVELSDIFGLPPEPSTTSSRFDDARLAISLLAACIEEYPSVPFDTLVAYVVAQTGTWPSSIRKTEASIKRVAQWITNEIAEDELQTEIHQSTTKK